MTPASTKRPRRDPAEVNRWLIAAIIGVVVLILTVGLWIVATGIMNPPTPRTYHERQLDLLETVVKQKPKAVSAWSDYVRALTAAKQYSAAQRTLARAEKVVGKDTPELALERARLTLARGDQKQGAAELAKALKITQDLRKEVLAEFAKKGVVVDPKIIKGPVMAEIARLQGDQFASEKKWPEAIKAYSIALVERPTDADLLVLRGSVYLETDDAEKAEADFKQALEYIPDFQPALDGMKRLEKGNAQ